LKIDWKLDREEVEGVFGTWDWDIELIAKQIRRQEDDRQFASTDTNGEWRGMEILGSPLCPSPPLPDM